MKLTDSKIQIDIVTAGIKKCSDNKRHRKRIEELENTEISTELNGGIVDKLEDEKFSLKHEKGKLKSQNLFLKVLLFLAIVGLVTIFLQI